MKKLLTLSTLTCIATAAMVPGQAFAEPSAALDRVGIWLGGYAANVDATVDARDPSRGLDAADQPILKGNTKVARARIDWLLMDSQGFSVDYYRIHQQRTQGVERAFTANGVNYDFNGAIAHDTKMDVGNFSYRFWLGQGDTVFGLGLGAQYYAIETELSARAALSGVGAFDAVTTEKRTGWAPLVTLGWRTRINDQWRVYADASGARHSNGGQSGSIVNAALGLEYFPTTNIGIGAEYGVSRIRYKREDGDAMARLNVRLDGPALFLRLRF